MRKTENLRLSLYDSSDKMNITGEDNSLNRNMEILDENISKKVSKEEGKGLSTYDYDQTAKDKVDAIPENPKYTDTVYDDTLIRKDIGALKINNSFPNAAKILLYECLEKVAWIDESGRNLLNKLKEELNVNIGLEGYVTDGIELWFDGIQNTRIEHAESLNVWEDLSGNRHDMTCVGDTEGTALKSATCGDDHVCFDGTTAFFNNDNISSLLSLNPGTVEVVFEQENGNGAQVIFVTNCKDNKSKNKGLWYRQSSNGYCIFATQVKSTAVLTDVKTVKTNISLTYTDTDTCKMTVNGEEITDFIDGGSMPCNKTFAVGGKIWHGTGSFYGFVGKIYAIRCYNRELTSGEIAQNLEADRARFAF